MLDKLSVREKYLIVVLLGLVLFIIIYYGFFVILGSKYLEVREMLHSSRGKLAEVRVKIEKINRLEAENDQLLRKLEVVKQPFDKEIRNGLNYFFIGKHVQDTSVVVTEITPRPSRDRKMYWEIPLSISVKGKYLDILELIQLLEEDMPVAMEIQNLSMQPDQDFLVTVSENNQIESDKSLKYSGDEKESEITVRPIVTDKNPDIRVTMELVTFLTKSPKAMAIVEQWSLGNWNAFSPAVDITKTALELSSKEYFYHDSDEVFSSSEAAKEKNKTVTGVNSLSQPESKDKTVSGKEPRVFPAKEDSVENFDRYHFPEKQ